MVVSGSSSGIGALFVRLRVPVCVFVQLYVLVSSGTMNRDSLHAVLHFSTCEGFVPVVTFTFFDICSNKKTSRPALG